MLLKHLRLKNIRSYNETEVEFRPGSTLLSGDIGSGKTTILLAIEFALFGIIRGVFSGSTLLRNGKKDGTVELNLEIDGRDVTISRSLKRTSSTVTQDAGFIVIDGVRTDATAVELKAMVLELLGYPEELLSKSKSLIFRYTVYTPQEDMKQILFDSTEDRLEKIRKIFDIDRYKRTKENAQVYAREMRSEMKAEAVKAEGLEDLKKDLAEKEQRIAGKEEEKTALIQKIESAKEKDALLRKECEAIEKQVIAYRNMKNDLKLNQLESRTKTEGIERYKEQMAEIKKELEEGVKQQEIPKTRTPEEIRKDVVAEREKLENINEKIQAAKNKAAVIASKIDSSKDIVNKIDELSICPTCKQEVTSDHKHAVEKEETDRINLFETKNLEVEEYLKKALALKKNSEEKIASLNEEQKECDKAEIIRKGVEQSKKRLELLAEKKDMLQEKVEELKMQLQAVTDAGNDIKKAIVAIKFDDEILEKTRKEQRACESGLKSLEIKEAEIRQILISAASERKRISGEIEAKEKIKKSLEKKRLVQNWLSNQFVNVVDQIEKNVMGNIHSDFNEKFREWFSMLMDDETINASLNTDFEPVIEQNGYDTDVSNLSGGEKTSVALAYRLALNKVINDFMGTIKTRDLLILDEPTDGFSSEQLDKVREVLEQLNSRQTILVSHEPKMESFVENVIRIRKHEHSSEII